MSLKDVGIYLSDGTFESYKGIVIWHPSKGTLWVVYINGKFFDSYGCVCPKKLSKSIIKRNGYCLYSKYKSQCLKSNRDSYCASYCFFIYILTEVIGIDFKSAVLNLYYQMIQ